MTASPGNTLYQESRQVVFIMPFAIISFQTDIDKGHKKGIMRMRNFTTNRIN